MNKKLISFFSITLSMILLLSILVFPLATAEGIDLHDPMQKTIDNCETVGNWKSGNGNISLDNMDKTEGFGSLKLTQAETRNTADIYTVFETPKDLTGLDYIEFDLYVNDIDIFGTDASVEISSSGKADEKERFWSLVDLKEQVVHTGWNHIKLSIENSGVNGGNIDLTAVNWFRIYFFHNKNKSITLKIDNLVATKAYAHNYTQAADLGFSLDQKTNNMFSAIKTNISLGLTQPKDSYALYLRVYLYSNDIPGDLTNFSASGTDGQIELTSSGTNDKQEINVLTRNLNWQNGWNDIVIPLSSMGATNGTGENSGAFDITKLNYMRLYHKVLNSQTFTMKITKSTILNVTEGLSMPTHYSDNMLFQQNKTINLKGTSAPNKRIDSVLRNSSTGVSVRSGFTTASASGGWEIELPALVGSYDEYQLEIYDSGALTKKFNDVVVGELWLTAGQSNMEFQLWATKDGDQLLKGELNDKFLRYLTMPTIPYAGNPSGNQPFEPQGTIKGAFWGRGDQKQFLSDITAVGYHFADNLRKALDMPVGIINAALGATSIYCWMPLETIDANAEMQGYLKSQNRYPTQQNWNTHGTNNFVQTMSTYNSKIAPLTNLNIAGMIWYQGESNSQENAGRYKKSLDLLYSDYSKRFGFEQGDMPFIYSHIAPHLYKGYSSEQTSYLAEDMSAFWKENQETTAQIAIYDIDLDYDFSEFTTRGVPDPIHPYVKKPIGERMAMSAMGIAYNKETETTSPVYKSSKAVDGALEITFDHVADGLAVKGEAGSALKGFTIAGADGIYVPAKAEIMSKNKVKVWNDTVKYPVSVTYAFTQMNMNANLVSIQADKIAYAAIPFRSEIIANAKYSHVDELTSMDYEKIWHSFGDTTADYVAPWKNGMIITPPANITYDKDVKLYGLSSLKLDYTADQYKSFGISPNLYVDMNKNFSQYDTVSFDVKNSGSGQVFIKEFIILFNGKYYTPHILGQNDCHKAIGSEWTNITIDLSKYYWLGNKNEFLTAAQMTSWEELQLTFYDNMGEDSKGTVHIDNLTFGFKPDKSEINKTELLNKVNEAREVNLSPLPSNVATAIRHAISYAESIVGNNAATQLQVNEALIELVEALDIEISEDQIKAEEVVALITFLPAVDELTLADKADIAAARAAFNNLTISQQELVDSAFINKLILLEAKIKQLEENATDLERVKSVQEKINALPEVSAVKVSHKSAVQSARSAYNDLNDAQKALVDSAVLNKLSALETKISELENQIVFDKQKADEVTSKINLLPGVAELKVSDKSAVQSARAAYAALTDVQKALVDSAVLNKLKVLEDKMTELENEKPKPSDITTSSSGEGTTTQTSSNGAQTGESSKVVLFMTLLGVSIVALSMIVRRSKVK